MYKTKADVDRVIAMGKPEKVIKAFLESYATGNQHAIWMEECKAEYEAAYPVLELLPGTGVEGEEDYVPEYYGAIEYDPPAPTFEEWMIEEDPETGELVREFMPQPVDVTEQVAAEVDKMDLSRAEKQDQVVIRLLLTLIQTLLDKRTISATDFSIRERELFQKVKAIHGRMF